MRATKRTAAGEAMTQLILALFSVNNRLLHAGDQLVASLGLTSARWQVLGTIVAAERPQPVAWLSRDLGANRQNVQRIVNDLEAEGVVAFEPNPHHRRAQLVVLTDKGRQIFEAAMRLQVPWVNGLASGLAVRDIEAAQGVLKALRATLESEGRPEE